MTLTDDTQPHTPHDDDEPDTQLLTHTDLGYARKAIHLGGIALSLIAFAVTWALTPQLGGHLTPPPPPKTPETSIAGPTLTSSPAQARPATGTAPQRIASNVPQPTVAKPPPTHTITATVTIPEPTPTTTNSSETDKPEPCDKPDPPRRCDDPTGAPTT